MNETQKREMCPICHVPKATDEDEDRFWDEESDLQRPNGAGDWYINLCWEGRWEEWHDRTAIQRCNDGR